MNRKTEQVLDAKSSAMAHWHLTLRDDVSLLAMPGAHHRALLQQAHSLHRSRVIDPDDLSDLLELADAALAYAIEALLDIDTEE